jgi:hypothetical protein
MRIKIDGDYGTREFPDEKVVIYCVDAPGLYPVHGRVGGDVESWYLSGTSVLFKLSKSDLVPLQAKPLTLPSCNWDHVDKKWTCMVKNRYGRVLFHTVVPIVGDYGWKGTEYVFAEALASLDKGTCDWRDSLVRRPT